MPPGDSFEGITVPRGDPDALRSAAGRLSGLSGRVEQVGAGIRALPGGTGGWMGPASVAFGAATVTLTDALAGARNALDAYGPALKVAAGDLEDAQRRAERAIDDARDARSRIDGAKARIDDASSRLAVAQTAESTLAVASAATGGLTDALGLADERAAASAAADAAARDLTAARIALEQAEDDLRAAQERGRQAEEEARDAKEAVARLLAGLAPGGAGLALVLGMGAGIAGTGGRPVFTPDGRIARLDLTVQDFDRMTVGERQQWMEQFQRQFGGAQQDPAAAVQYDFDGWFNNIDGILQYAEDRNTITPGTASTPGSWFSLVDAAILHGIQGGYAIASGRSNASANPGAARWADFFRARRLDPATGQPAASADASKKLWAPAEQASTDYGSQVIAPQAGRTPSTEESVFLWIGDRYRQDLVPNLPEWAPGYGLLDPRNEEFTRDIAEGIDDTTSEAVEGARETTDEGLEAAEEILRNPTPAEVFEGAAETGGQVLEGAAETGLQVGDTALDAGDDLLEEGGRVIGNAADAVWPG